ncbi:MAG: hypothetical protein EOP04_24785 [Proteobacteria bacterium]|nr:MAG: hypothetical protein EOP04_24785 [Pseudomonadota bacterium]
MRLSSFKVLNVGDKLFMIAVSIAVAFISWKYIELPFRKRSFIGRRKLWIATAVIALLLLCMSLFGYYKEGFPERMGPLALRTYNEMQTIEFARLTQNGRVCRSRQPSEACAFGDQSWVTIGDSTVGVLEPTLQKALEQNNLGLITMNFDQCLLGNNMWFGNETRCPQINEERWKVIEEWSDKKTVVISHRGWFFSDAKEAGSTQRIAEKSVIEHIDQNITKLLEKGHRVILVYPVPDPGFELKPLLASVVMRQKEGKLLRKFSSVESAYEDAMSYSRIYDKVPDHPGLIRIYPADLLCPDKGAGGRRQCLVIGEAGPYYNSGEHLSRLAAGMVNRKIFEAAIAKWNLALEFGPQTAD